MIIMFTFDSFEQLEDDYLLLLLLLLLFLRFTITT